MRTATLSFKAKGYDLTMGIKAKDLPNKQQLELFAHHDRVLMLPVDLEHPPLVMYPIGGHTVGQLHLAMVSLVSGSAGELCASLEIDTREQVLMLIDTIDDVCEQVNSGEYAFSHAHDDRLPHAFVPTRYGPSQYGLIVCSPGDEFVVRSTTGHLLKIKLCADGKFVRIACDARDRLLMDGRI